MTITPTSQLTSAQPDSLLGAYAGFISRLLAILIDTILVSVTFVAITWFVSVTATMLQVRTFLGFSINAIPGSGEFIDALFGPAAGSLLTALYLITYHVFFLSLTGQTPGKALMGLRVVPKHGGRVSPLRAFLRTVGYFLSIIPLGFGFLSVLTDDKRQAWHDKVAGTCVVYTWAARPDETFLKEEIKEITRQAESPLRK